MKDYQLVHDTQTFPLGCVQQKSVITLKPYTLIQLLQTM